MALSVDTTASATSSSGALSVNMTLAASANLIVMLYSNGTGGDPSGRAPTWNGVAMNYLGGAAFSGSDPGAGIWYLANPATGAHTLDMPGAGGGGSFLAGISFIGADAGSFGATSFTAPASGNLSQAITSQAANSILVDCCSGNNQVTPTQGGSQTLISANNQGVGGCGGGQSRRQLTTIGSYTNTWTITSANRAAFCIAEVKPAPLTAGNFLPLI